MLKTIIIHELQNHLYNLRFSFTLILTVLLFSISSVAYVIEYKENKTMYEQGMIKLEEFKSDMAFNASRFAQFQNSLPLEPRNSGFIASCREESIPNTIFYSAFNVFGFEIIKGSKNPFVLPSENVNWEFIIIVLFSFLAIIYTFNSISGEKEMRTLSLGLSNSVSRGVLLTGKFLGTLMTLTLFLILSMITSIFILLVSGQVMIDGTTMAEISGFLVLSVLLIACMTAIGLLSSVISYHANTSLLTDLLVWLVFLFVIPHTSLLLSDELFPVEKEAIINQNTREARDATEASFPGGKWHSDGGNPFEPDHEIRANMHMAFMLGEKKIKDRWYQDQFRQYTGTRALACISPMFLFETGDEYLLDGGFQRFRKNWNDLHIYQSQFLDWFKAFDAKDEDSPHWYNPFEDYSTSKKPIKIEEVPVYTEQEIPVAERLTEGSLYIAVLLGYTTVLLFISFLIFSRYDVR